MAHFFTEKPFKAVSQENGEDFPTDQYRSFGIQFEFSSKGHLERVVASVTAYARRDTYRPTGYRDLLELLEGKASNLVVNRQEACKSLPLGLAFFAERLLKKTE